MAAYFPYNDLVIHHESETFRMRNVDRKSFSYIELLNRVSELVLKHVSTSQPIDLSLTYRFPNTEVQIPLETDMDLVMMFHMHSGGTVINIYVEHKVHENTESNGVDLVVEDIGVNENSLNDGTGTEVVVGNVNGLNIDGPSNEVVLHEVGSGSGNGGRNIDEEWEEYYHARTPKLNYESYETGDSEDEDYVGDSSEDQYESFTEMEEEQITIKETEGLFIDGSYSRNMDKDALNDVDDEREDGLGVNSDSDKDIPGQEDLNGPQFGATVNDVIELKKRMLFMNLTEFRSALRDFTIQEGFDIIRIKNERTRVTCRCLENPCVPNYRWSHVQDQVLQPCSQTTMNADNPTPLNGWGRNGGHVSVSQPAVTRVTDNTNVGQESLSQPTTNNQGKQPMPPRKRAHKLRGYLAPTSRVTSSVSAPAPPSTHAPTSRPSASKDDDYAMF